MSQHAFIVPDLQSMNVYRMVAEWLLTMKMAA